MEQWNGVLELLAAVDQGTLSKAAKHLGVSPSHVTKRIQGLEERLGIKLLARSTRSLNLTEIGEQYYATMKPLVNSLEDQNRYFTELQNGERGILKISAPLGVGEDLLMESITEFSNRYPNIQLTLDFSTRTINLIEEKFDLALRLSSRLDGGMVAKKVLETQYHLLASPEYFSKMGRPQDPSELSEHLGLAFSQPDSNKPIQWQFASPESGERFNVGITAKIRSNSVKSLVRGAIKGAGIIYASRFFVEDALRDGLLEPVLQEWVPDRASIWAVFPERKQLPRKTRLFVDHVTDWFADSTRVCSRT
ncbi:LysR family transcriptional regulator [Pseudobacteriovorax antillogorgiicola]|uniref:LysR family transcriptional regulator, regulator for bpeEF and oprC n=1 Tax=Pseudobacteriovorax antillogorgiicola TaxID=1513793 RepID=A0A1Y6CJX0_9BACT|nr:LysR family transcriptional regulator [Pseudobacteriovorax antillogorgiicola]TCS47993.1 LysR family transcriptional regulator for bpeEF and oprC [Pseudobacteriovorax antillogorgiicola]SMF58470.1 LysR family transcriptional regulator, regulator for bpeEF and oprC [Pseudobacteriovorax antillogorgiicola]